MNNTREFGGPGLVGRLGAGAGVQSQAAQEAMRQEKEQAAANQCIGNREAEIPSRLRDAHLAANTLLESVGELGNRLSPILRLAPSPEKRDTQPGPASTAIGNDLAELVTKLETLQSFVSDMLRTLEL